MPTHPLDTQLSERLINDVAELKRQMREMRTLQLNGGDAIEVVGTNLVETNFTLAAGASSALRIDFTPDNPVVMNVDCYVSVQVDLIDGTRYWPDGDMINIDQRKLRLSVVNDWAFSSDITGERSFIVFVENFGIGPHDYYLEIKCYAPKNPAIGS